MMNEVNTMSETLLLIFECIGTVSFAVSGAMTAIAKKMDIFGVMILGIITAVGGGVLRDLLVQRMPLIFHKRVYALADILGACVYIFLIRRGFGVVLVSAATIALVFAIRMLATKYHWNLPKAE